MNCYRMKAQASINAFYYMLSSAPEEKEEIKGQYEKLLDGYGCLGQLQLKSGKYLIERTLL